MLSYILVVLFTDTGVSQEYQFNSKASCEAAKAPVVTLYENLGQPVKLSCKPRVKSISEPATESVKTSYKVRTSYKF